MAGNGSLPRELTPKQRRAVQALMTAPTIAEAAKTAGCGERSLFRWLKDPVFLAELQAATRAAIDVTVRRMATLSVAATGTLAKTMTDADTPAAVKVRAADVILSRLPDWRELTQLEERLAALEAALRVRA
jgi:phage terminase small subunit